jgi:hypothetical protein
MAAQIGSDDLEIDSDPRLDLLIEVAGIDPEPGREWARLEGPPLGFRSTQRLRVSDCPEGLAVTTWPAELADQARYLYGGRLGTPLAAAAFDLGWTVEATPHIAYHRAAPDRRLYLNPVIAPLQYTALWENDEDALRRLSYPREDVENQLWPWLKQHGLADDGDDPELLRFLDEYLRGSAHLRPGLRLRRIWTSAEAARLGSSFADAIRDEFNSVFSHAREPMLGTDHRGGRPLPRPQPDNGSDERAGWPAAEIEPTVRAYFTMLRAELAGQPYVKAAANREVQASTGRSRGAVEFKFANISAVLRDIGLPYVQGYQPRGNYQAALRTAVEQTLARDTEVARLLEEAPVPELPSAEHLTEVPPPAMPSPVTTGRRRPAVGVNYLERQERNRDVGLKGELLVVKYEQAWLAAQGRTDLAERVTHIPATLGDGAGYDVGSFLPDGTPHHIEVKATRGSITAPFFLSASELRYARDHPAAYSIYRLFDLGPKPGFYKLTGGMDQLLDLTPVSYQARVKAP